MNKAVSLFVLLCSFFVGTPVSAQCDASFSYSFVYGAPGQVAFQPLSQAAGVSHRWFFGDGNGGAMRNPVYQYSYPGQYGVLHVVTDSASHCTDSVRLLVNVQFSTSCKASFTARRDTLHPSVYHFTSTSSGAAQPSWKINGVHASSQDRFSKTLSPGTYHVCLSLSSTTCADSVCQQILVPPVNCNLQADFTWSPTSHAGTFQFTGLPSQPRLLYQWNFGDGKSALGRTPTHYYVQPGTYTVRLVVKDSVAMCTSDIQKQITVSRTSSDSCSASFTWMVDGISTNVVRFHSGSLLPGLRHRWNFGDGSPAGSGANPSHAYTRPGTYTVFHEVTDSFSHCSDTVTQLVPLQFPISCPVNFRVMPDSNHQQFYRFVAEPGISASDITSYQWSVNGRDFASGPQLNFMLNAGSNVVCLRITTRSGCIDSICKTVTVTNPQQCNLTASFTYTPTNHPRQFIFQASPVRNGLRYQWQFGDHTALYYAAPVQVKQYLHAGNYQVRLIIYDSLTGCRDTAMRDIHAGWTAADSCSALFRYTTLNTPNHIQFKALSNQSISSQNWTFQLAGDTTRVVDYSFDPVRLFADTGMYKVCVSIITSTGCRKTACDFIRISSTVRTTTQSHYIPSYPNPARQNEDVKVDLVLPANSPLLIRVYNASGYQVLERKQEGFAGQNQIQIPARQLVSGQYFIEIIYGRERKRSLFQKL